MMRNMLRLYRAAAAVFLMLVASGSQAADNAYSVTGGWKSLHRDGNSYLKIPTFVTFPLGSAPTGVVIQATDGANDAPPMVVPGHLFSFRRSTAATPNFGNPGRLVGAAISLVGQLRTNFSGVGPFVAMPLAVNGRSGPSTVSYCPGGTQTGGTVFNGSGGFNPNCTAVEGTPTDPISGVGIANGRLVYTRTTSAMQKGNQYGGVGQLALRGTGDVARVISPVIPPANRLPPYTGAGAFAWQVLGRPGGNVFSLQPDGMAFAQSSQMLIFPPAQGNLIFATTLDSGIVTPLGLGPALGTPSNPTVLGPDILTAWGGPWTTGNVTVSMTRNPGAPFAFEIFTLEGSDTRSVAGSGTLQLVSGSLSQSFFEGRATQTATIRMTLTSLPEPSAWVSAGVALLTLTLCRAVTRR
jgi:hypothetical protein